MSDPREKQAGSGAADEAGRSPGPTVRVLVEDPELAAGLSSPELEQATREAVAPLLRLPAGRSGLGFEQSGASGYFGLLVLAGVIARHVSFAELTSSELVGPGDVLRPWISFRRESESARTRWEVLTDTRIAVLDRDFAYRVQGWPEISAALLDRTRERLDSQLLQSALRQARRVEDRVALAIWHLAERWGEATPDGLLSPDARLTGELLARIVGARRQSVSTALGALADRGVVRRGPGGRLILPLEAPALDTARPQEPPPDRSLGRRASDR